MTVKDDDIIWSGSDLPYMCLIDQKRTLAFKDAIESVVNQDDIVVDVGSGSGILAFFAAKAGAKKVYAVEIDSTLANWIRSSVEASGLSDIIEVIEGDVLEIDLPKNIDVVIAEIIETGLLEEMQVKVMNDLRHKGIISAQTKVIPQKYETRVSLAELENDFYGFKINSPVHNWPNYSSADEDWLKLRVRDLTEPYSVGIFDFQSGFVDPEIQRSIDFKSKADGKINALKIEGIAHLTETISIGATNTINGDKYLILESDQFTNKSITIHYTMGRGLADVKVSPN